jgi:hypothetical protein
LYAVMSSAGNYGGIPAGIPDSGFFVGWLVKNGWLVVGWLVKIDGWLVSRWLVGRSRLMVGWSLVGWSRLVGWLVKDRGSANDDEQ